MSDEEALGKQSILNAGDIKTEPLDVPEWGGRVWLRVLSGKERDAFEAIITGPLGGKQNARARFAVLVLANEKGDRIFADGDAEKLGEKSGLALYRIWEAGLHLNDMMAADVEEAAGNSSGGRSDGSGSL